MEQRIPNTICKVCKKPIYRRPKQLASCKNSYCSKKCYGIAGRILAPKICLYCDRKFQPTKSRGKFCSIVCARNQPRGKYKQHAKVLRGCKGEGERRLKLLQLTFKFNTCMVERCRYNRTYDIHRLIPGCNGGKYEIGNMFAICPNHHAELHRKIATAEKINDQQLKLTYGR